MRKWIACILTVLLAVSVLAGCGKTEEAAKKDKVKVAVSFDAMGEFVKAVGKDKVEVHTVIPAGTEPHGFEPSTETMKALSGADVFVYNELTPLRIRIRKKWKNTVNSIPMHGSV